MKFIRFLPVIFLLSVVLVFFKPFIVEGKLPIPSDTIIGLYHPFRDLYAKDYERGIQYKNALITDPVRQQYPWRELSINIIKNGELPLWNSYSMAGYPLLGNLQSAVFYPLNIVFLLLPFSFAWGMLIFLQPLLAGIFLYLYLNSLRLNKWAGLLGAIIFAFGGFSIAWMEWGTVLHSALWLPLLLLSIDKILLVNQENSKLKTQNSKLQVKTKNLNLIGWSVVFIFSLSSSLFAGHLQIFFYVFITSLVYLIVRWWQFGKNKKTLLLFVICYLLFVAVTAVQWIPTVQLILQSGRGIDQADWTKPDWFIPWQHLIQFIAPDFFGNPATDNYWGVWNYAEFVGYVGILPLILALFAMFYRWDKKTLFYGSLLFLSLIFSLPTIFAKIPYILNIPFISTAQPTRLLFIADFSLAILAALGFDLFLRDKKRIVYPLTVVGLIVLGLWLFILFFGQSAGIGAKNLLVAVNNLRLPTILFISSSVFLIIISRLSKAKITFVIYFIIVLVIVLDLIRFGWKFTPFTSKAYLFPSTSVLSFLQKQEGQFRIAAIDDRIFPPNFSVIYRLQTVDGYDPLYPSRYGELIAASERGQANINPPFGFNRIITPKNFDSKIIDLLGVKYILSLSDISSPKLTKVFQEGQTRVYENKNAMPRAFFAEKLRLARDKNEAIKMMFDEKFNQDKIAVVENMTGAESIPFLKWNAGKVQISEYSNNKVIIYTENDGDGFLVLTDSFYPAWQAIVDGTKTEIYRTDYNFRGIVVPGGKHTIIFSINLL